MILGERVDPPDVSKRRSRPGLVPWEERREGEGGVWDWERKEGFRAVAKELKEQKGLR